MSDEERGIQAKIALNERYIELASAELKAADAQHWQHLREHELYDLLRQRDRLNGQIQLVRAQNKQGQKK